MLTSLENAFRGLFRRQRKHRRQKPRGRSAWSTRFHPAVEVLEVRTVPSTLPDLVGYDFRPGNPTAYFHVTDPSPVSWGSLIHLNFNVLNIDATPAAPETYSIAFYLSADSTIDTADVLLANINVGNVPSANHAFLYSGYAMALPATNPFGGSGPYYVGMIINPGNVVAESNYANDSNQGNGIDLAPLPVNPGVSITTASLANWTAGKAGYSQTIVASGGTGPYTYGATGTLPPGLSLSSGGILSGTPTTAGSYNFTVTATDSVGGTGSASYTVTINPAVAITTASLSSWIVNQAGYSQSINATGGTGSLTFNKASGTLPAGLTLSSAGVLSGTPTTAGSYTFTVQATDTVGASATASYTVTISTSIHLAVNAPATTTAGANFLFTVQAEDASNNPYSGFSGLVTLSTTDPHGTVPGPMLVTNGLGTFLGTLQTVAGSPWTISATSGALSATSAPIAVTPAFPVKLVFAQQPVNTPTGYLLPTVTVQVQDQYGNVVTSDNTDAVTLAVASGPGSFTSTSTTTVVANNGVASFSNAALVVPGTYTLSAFIPQAFSGRFSNSFTVAPLQVLPGSFAGSPSGFSLRFNAPYLINATTPILYGQGFGATAPVPSVTLTEIQDGSGNPVNIPINGSLVLDAANNAITFLASTTTEVLSGSPVLADGAYQVVVHGSAATHGLQALDSGGGFLDGLGTGTPGSGDFTTTFTVDAQSQKADVLWIPPTADGPGQPLNAPGANQSGGGYPLYLDDSSGTVTDVLATLTYNPALLTVTGVTGAGFSLLSGSTPGSALLQYNGPALPTGLQTPVGFLTATVPAGSTASPVPYKAQDLLHLANVSLNRGSIPVATGDALHLVAYVGDGDGNGSYSSNDAVLITRVTIQVDSGFAAYAQTDPVIVADTDGAGFLPADAGLQANEACPPSRNVCHFECLIT